MAQVIRLGKYQRVLADGRLRFWMFPSRPIGSYSKAKFLYAIGYADGRAKIGVARNVRARIVHHWSESNGQVTWAHVFSAVVDAYAIERLACSFASQVGHRIRRTETFTDLPRDMALACVRRALREQV